MGFLLSVTQRILTNALVPFLSVSIAHVHLVDEVPITTVTKYHTRSGLKQCPFIISQVSQSEL